ncbi:MAG: hypothetical protein V2I41_21045 [Pseudomonadales bacterium]|jgi:hypothetical protein|nr:hypothetical protein [Pseudomonadales bacterium]
MQFTKRLREPIKNHEITQSVRIWKSPRVKVGNAYRLAPGFIVIESLREIGFEDITAKLARETGFSSLADLLKTAKHGSGERVYLVKFHYHEKLD